MYRSLVEKLQAWKLNKDRKPLILFGARQIGKTYLLNEFGEKFFKNYIYINFEKNPQMAEVFEQDLDPTRIVKELEFKFKKPFNKNEDLLIFDEIQAAPKAITSLKYFCEDMPELALCSAGSLLGIKHGESSFPVGKVDLLNMYPMSFAEFLLACDHKDYHDFLENFQRDTRLPDFIHEDLFRFWKIYLAVGGLPAVVSSFAENKEDLNLAFNKVRETQESIINIHLADIAKHCGKVNAMHIERVWNNIPNQLSKTQDGSAAKFKFKGVVPNLKGYSQLVGAIDWLLAAGLAIKVPIINHASLPLKAYVEESQFKLLMYDVGILGALASLDPAAIMDYQYGTYKGFFAENFVAQEFAFSSGRVDRLYSWQEAKSEVEFVREIETKVIPLEVKSGHNTRARSIDVFAKKYQSPYKVIFSANKVKIDSESNTHRYPLYMAYKFPLKF